jgi:SAM-dependent methyltransferase
MTGLKTFDAYARYYDVLYGKKDYESECNFLEKIFQTFASHPVRRVLDLGCGAGGHDLPLGRRGYAVLGVDCSPQMLVKARGKAEQASLEIAFHEGDIHNLNLVRTFNAVIAMFAVVSYHTTNANLSATFRSARRHILPGGLFVFGAWFGPAVLGQGPGDRVKTIEKDGERVIRLAKPVLNVLHHTVRVNYKVMRIKDGRVLDEVTETHLMRFFFPQEITHYLENTGFKLLQLCPFMRLDRSPTEQDWNVAIIAVAE